MRIISHEEFMHQALVLAQNSSIYGEVPVGAIVVCDGKIIAKAHNAVEKESNPLRHAEILALEAAIHATKTRDLSNCTLYTTLEPCGMCAGAIAHMRVGTVVFGAYDEQYGCAISATNLFQAMGSDTKVIGGVLGGECKKTLDAFFARLRLRT